jgi:hypothetical protein
MLQTPTSAEDYLYRENENNDNEEKADSVVRGLYQLSSVTYTNNEENAVEEQNKTTDDTLVSANDNSNKTEKSVDTGEKTSDNVSSKCNRENVVLASEMLITMSQSSAPNLEQLEEKDQITEGLRLSLKDRCKEVMESIETHESRQNIKAIEIAEGFAKYLTDNTAVKLYTLEKGTRSKESSGSNTDIILDGLFLKASPFLFLAYNEMKELYRNSGIRRWDQSFKNFTWNVFDVLITLDNNLEPLNNYKLRKAHNAELLKDRLTLYWLDPIPEINAASTNKLTTDNLQDRKINSVSN